MHPTGYTTLILDRCAQLEKMKKQGYGFLRFSLL